MGVSFSSILHVPYKFKENKDISVPVSYISTLKNPGSVGRYISDMYHKNLPQVKAKLQSVTCKLVVIIVPYDSDITVYDELCQQLIAYDYLVVAMKVLTYPSRFTVNKFIFDLIGQVKEELVIRYYVDLTIEKMFIVTDRTAASYGILIYLYTMCASKIVMLDPVLDSKITLPLRIDSISNTQTDLVAVSTARNPTIRPEILRLMNKTPLSQHNLSTIDPMFKNKPQNITALDNRIEAIKVVAILLHNIFS